MVDCGQKLPELDSDAFDVLQLLGGLVVLHHLRQRHDGANDARRRLVHDVVGSVQFSRRGRFKLLEQSDA